MDPESLIEVCTRLIKYKKENKELLTYIVYETDETIYIHGIKEEMDLQFSVINFNNFYYIKKSLRKTLRFINKYIRFSGNSETELELVIYFCNKIKEMDVNISKSTSLHNIYLSQLKRLNKLLGSLHEDLQYDYRKQIKLLE